MISTKIWRGHHTTRALILLSPSILLAILAGSPARAQQVPPTERLYNHQQMDVEKAIQELHGYETQRLPVLSGFVNAPASSLDHLQNPRFQFHIDLVSQGAAQTVVRVSAKITAWYEDAGVSRSQYTAVPSNGRLEEDFLDRLSVKLEKGAPPQHVEGAGGLHSPPGASPISALAPGGSAAAGGPLGGQPASPNAPPAPSPPNSAEGLAGQIASLRVERETLEQKERKLNQQISELQSASRSEVYLRNMAVIRATQTPLFEQDQDTSKVLFRADPDDEFQIVETRGDWLRVSLENGAEAWLRASQLRQPGDQSDPDPANLNFTAANEEVKAFGGDWSQLKGKTAFYVFAQPARQIPDAALGKNQLQFAEYTFVEGYRAATHSQQQMDGVVVVFLGPKGGVAAATLADIRRWREGYLTDKVFLERCSLDPPDSFSDAQRR
ncbi:MAG: SH3 domain-containing protein [Candidatus Acidiferrales bacterium]